MIGNLFSARRAAVELDLEKAKLNFTVVLGATHLPRMEELKAEVDRRAEVIEHAWRTSTMAPPMHTTPKACALRSVTHDIVLGVL